MHWAVVLSYSSIDWRREGLDVDGLLSRHPEARETKTVFLDRTGYCSPPLSSLDNKDLRFQNRKPEAEHWKCSSEAGYTFRRLWF